MPAARMWSAAASSSPSPLELSEALGPEVEAHTPAVEAVHVLERSGERVAPWWRKAGSSAW